MLLAINNSVTRNYQQSLTAAMPRMPLPIARLEEGCIRFVRILHDPHHLEDCIRCETRICRLLSGDDMRQYHTPRQKKVRYSALSYAWGDPTPQRQILVDGHSRMIADNLWQFLRQAKTKSLMFSGWLWIDALSIDQTDPEERRHQVGIMSKIFLNADQVVAWLGQSYDNSDATMTALSMNPPYPIESVFNHTTRDEYCSTWNSHASEVERLRRTLDLQTLYGETASAAPSWDEVALAITKYWAQSSGSCADFDERLKEQEKEKQERYFTVLSKSIVGLCQRPYWKRLWVFQELRHAASIQLMCGGMIIPWEAFSNIWHLMAKLRALNDDAEEKLRRSLATRMVTLRANRMRSSLWNLLQETKDLDCADNRDRVYALLSVAMEGCQGIEADYRAHVNPCDLAHCVLRNRYALRPPNTLKDVILDCESFVDTFQMEWEGMFSYLHASEEAPGKFDIHLVHGEPAFVHPEASWSVWAQYHDHIAVTKLFQNSG
jgi:hypothetical protein